MSSEKRRRLFHRRMQEREPIHLLLEAAPDQSAPEETRPAAPAVSAKIAAAIDFGTHGTGFAWAIAEELDKDPNTRSINYHSDWSGTLTSYPKNLSALLLDGDKVKYWGYDAKRRWARAMAEGKDGNLGYAYAFKMALKPSRYADSLPRGQGRIRVRTPQDAYPLIVAYLEKMKQSALQAISETGYQESGVHWCVTVPAIWDTPDWELMRKAAVEAGFPPGRLLLAREPEAAALQCQVHMARLSAADEGYHDLSAVGSRFVVADCGGGTVDITAYRVIRSTEGEQQLDELCRASGGKFGSEYINREFVRTALSKHFGGRALLAEVQRRFPLEMLEIVDQWEREKVSVEVEVESGKLRVTDSILLGVPYSIVEFLKQKLPSGERVRSRITIAPEEIGKLFESSVGPVLREIAGRLAEIRSNAGAPSGPEVLLLVGGFAASKYLQESIRLRFGDEVKVIVPNHTAAAVMFGAVRLCHRPAAIHSRRARYTYGISWCQRAESPADDEREKFPDDDGVLFCSRFMPDVHVGESVGIRKEIDQVCYPLRRSDKSFWIILLAGTEHSPRYPDDPGVKKLGSFEVDISESTGQPVSERGIRLKLHFDESDIRVEARNPRTGVEYRITAEFDYY